MAKLQTPEFALRNGELIPWDDATLHIGTEAVNRGLSVFEGLKGYWSADGVFGLVQVRAHYERLLRSARLLHIPCPWSYEQYEAGLVRLIGALADPDRDMWVRTTLFVVEGHWGEQTRADLFMTAYHQSKEPAAPIRIGVSTWQRSADNALPYRVKSAANYQVGRMARIEGRRRGCDDMVLLNRQGRVAEMTGSALLLVRDGAIFTPSDTEGVLPSITTRCAEAIAKSMDVPFIRRPVDRTELYIADELCECGTLSEMVPVSEIDGYEMDAQGPVLGELRRRYMTIVRGAQQHPAIEITQVPQ
jgi:branched-chain amino acid aminotransferase